jgi:hypothetical protein
MRFAVLHHTSWPGRADHYDLLIEQSRGVEADDLALKTFATLADVFPGDGAALQAIRDHRRAYLWLEGPVSGGRGTVARADEGECQPLQAGGGFRFQGRRLAGAFVFQTRDDGLLALRQA